MQTSVIGITNGCGQECSCLGFYVCNFVKKGNVQVESILTQSFSPGIQEIQWHLVHLSLQLDPVMGNKGRFNVC